VTTFKEEEFEHLDWDKDVGVFEDTYTEPEPPALTEEQGLYVTVSADGSLVADDGAVFAVLANGVLKSANGSVFTPTGVVLDVDNALADAALAFEGTVALADGVKLEEGRKFVIKQQQLGEGETLLSFLGGAEFVDGAGRLFRRAADGTFLGADLDNLEAWVYSGSALTAKGDQKLEGDMQQGSSEWKWVVGDVELERGAKITVKPKIKSDGDVLLLKSDGTLVDGAGGVYSVTPEGLLVGPDGVLFGATGLIMTPAGVAQNATVSISDGGVLANGNAVAAGSKIVVKKQSVNKSDGDVLFVKSDGTLADGAGNAYSVTPNGLLVGPEGIVYGATGVVLTPAGMAENAAVSFGDGKVLANGNGIPAGSKLVVKKQPVNETDGNFLLVNSDGTLADGAGNVYSITPNGLLVGADGIVLGATGVVMTPAGIAQNAAVSFGDGKVFANGDALAAGSKIIVQKQIAADEGTVVMVCADGLLQGVDGTKYTMRSDGKLVSEGNKVFKGTGKVVTAEQNVLTDATTTVDESGKIISAAGAPLLAGAKIVIHQKEEEEELEPPPKPVTIKGEVTLKDSEGHVFAEVHKDDADGTVIGAESVIIIKNAKGKEVVRITRGYVTVKNFNVEEIVQIMRGVVSVKTMAGKEMVHVEKGEIYIEDFDGEVIVNNLADVNKLDEEMSLKNL